MSLPLPLILLTLIMQRVVARGPLLRAPGALLSSCSAPLRRGYVTAAVSDANWQEAVEQASHAQPVIVDFTASWCGPCRILAPVLSDAVKAAGKVSLVAYDIDESSERAEEFQVSAVPSVFAFSKGKKVGEFRGSLPASKVAEFIEEVKRKHAASE